METLKHSSVCSFRPCKRSKRDALIVRAKKSTDSESPNPGLGLKAVWLGAENFGKVIGLGKGKGQDNTRQSQRKMSREEVIASIKADYDVNYFVSGKGDMEAYDPDCLFADPFAGFNGVDRFKQNVSNLGGLMEDVKLDILKFEDQGIEVETKWRFSALLQLPWRPRLAAAGGTTHVLDQETGKVVKHIEAWDVEPGKVLKQLLRPASSKPANNAEKFMLALSEGDVRNMWLASSLWALVVASPTLLLTQVAQLTTSGQALGFLTTVQTISCVVLIVASTAQIYKFASPSR